MRCSLLTMYKSPTATADNRTVSKSAAMSVKPRESRVLFSICIFLFSLLNTELKQPSSITELLKSLADGAAAAVGIAKTHIAGADRSRQIHALGLFPFLKQAFSHHPYVDLLDQGGGIPSCYGIGQICIHKAVCGTDHVIAELQVDDAIRHRNGGQAVDLAHQARRLHSSTCGGNLQEISNG